jgi:hypothetical protein
LAILKGTGFNNRQQVSASGTGGTTLSASANRIEAVLPAGSLDGVATIQVTDPVSGGFSQMIGALTYGASSTDLLLLLQGSETASVVGAAAANPLRVRAVAADGVTPVSGATIAWSATNGLQFSACGGAAACSVLSDEGGESASLVTPTAIGQSTVTIALAPASYTTPQTRQATVVATSSVLDLVATTPTRWVGQGATLSIPLSVEALNLGAPKPNVTINFLVTNGTATLSAASATTSSSGFATVSANITNQNADVQVIACVAPNNVPCQTFTLFSTPASLWKLETVTGSSQFVLSGQAFQPLVMRVTDSSGADNPVMGVNVVFNTTLAQISVDSSPTGGQQGGESAGGGGGGMPVILGSSRVQVSTAVNGVASIVPSAGNVGPCDVFIAVSAGSSTLQFQMESEAAIVLQQQLTKIRGASAAAHTMAGAAPTAEAESAPLMLFAVPQSGLSDLPLQTLPVPTQESCSESHRGAASANDAEDGAANVCGPEAPLPAREVDLPTPAADALAKPAPTKPGGSKQLIDKPIDGMELDRTVEPAAKPIPTPVPSSSVVAPATK